ncbi:MAG: hypothetical protein Q7S45_04630 [Candidatus Curtissbacteria bacterium]|nr:hypothetical protein [Candidatus Curtissbacteria bacterium]
MNIITIILVVLIAFFVLSFILGVVLAPILGSGKKRRARALVLLSQMTEEQITALKDIFIAYKANDIEKANRVSGEASPEIISSLVDFFDYNNRPVGYSSGKAGRHVWVSFESKLNKLGYSEVVSKIIPVVVMDNYNEVLQQLADNQSKQKA